MSEREKKVIENLKVILPKLSELEVEKLLSYGEGMAFMVAKREEVQAST